MCIRRTDFTDYRHVYSMETLPDTVLLRGYMEEGAGVCWDELWLLLRGKNKPVAVVWEGALSRQRPDDILYRRFVCICVGSGREGTLTIDCNRLRADLLHGGRFGALIEEVQKGHRVQGGRGHLTKKATSAWNSLIGRVRSDWGFQWRYDKEV